MSETMGKNQKAFWSYGKGTDKSEMVRTYIQSGI